MINPYDRLFCILVWVLIFILFIALALKSKEVTKEINEIKKTLEVLCESNDRCDVHAVDEL